MVDRHAIGARWFPTEFDESVLRLLDGARVGPHCCWQREPERPSGSQKTEDAGNDGKYPKASAAWCEAGDEPATSSQCEADAKHDERGYNERAARAWKHPPEVTEDDPDEHGKNNGDNGAATNWSWLLWAVQLRQSLNHLRKIANSYLKEWWNMWPLLTDGFTLIIKAYCDETGTRRRRPAANLQGN